MKLSVVDGDEIADFMMQHCGCVYVVDFQGSCCEISFEDDQHGAKIAATRTQM